MFEFLCSALANAQRNGVERTLESVEQWELTGIYPRIAGIIGDLDYTILPDAAGRVALAEHDAAKLARREERLKGLTRQLADQVVAAEPTLDLVGQEVVSYIQDQDH